MKCDHNDRYPEVSKTWQNHTHTHTQKDFEDVLVCKTVCFAICEHTTGYKGEELIRDVSEEGRQMASNTAFYITLRHVILYISVGESYF